MGKLQPQPELFDPVELQKSQRPRWGYWTLNTKTESGHLRQRVYNMSQYEFVLENCRKDLDTYTSQCVFSAQNRRAINVKAITHAYIDLDTYNLAAFEGYTPDQMVGAIRIFCEDLGIPPSSIISSGRGYYVKWFFDQPLPKKLGGLFVMVLKRLKELFAEFGADKCTDLSRILRVVGTINSKSGQRAELMFLDKPDGMPRAWRFEDFANEVMPYSFEEVRQHKAKRKRYSDAQIASFAAWRARQQRQRIDTSIDATFWTNWHWLVVTDVLELAKIRFAGGYVSEKQRDNFGHILTTNLAHVVSYGELWREIQAFARQILPSDYLDSDFTAHCSTVLDRAKEAAAGKTVTFNGKKVSPIYTYKKSTIIDFLGITSDEMKHMAALIDKSEKQRRQNNARREGRRKTGLSRDEWVESVKSGSEKETKPWEAMGISRASYYRKKKAGGL